MSNGEPKIDAEPVKPIVFYVGRGVPKKWKPYVKKGIEMWQPAFEAAGFKNAILAKDPPSKREDPNWDAEDARYSTIRWLPSTVENAQYSAAQAMSPRTTVQSIIRLLTRPIGLPSCSAPPRSQIQMPQRLVSAR